MFGSKKKTAKKTSMKGANKPVQGKTTRNKPTKRSATKTAKKPPIKLGESVPSDKGEYSLVKDSGGDHVVLFDPYMNWNGKNYPSHRNVRKEEVGSLTQCRNYIKMATGSKKEQAALKKKPKWDDWKREPHQGYKNYDTFLLAVQIKNNDQIGKYLSDKENRNKLLKMKREDVVQTLKKNGIDLSGITVKNINATELKKVMKERGNNHVQKEKQSKRNSAQKGRK